MPAIYFIGDGDGAWEDLDPSDLWIADPDRWQLALLSDGMKSGAPSLALRLECPHASADIVDHTHTVFAETSVEAWMMATAAIKGNVDMGAGAEPLEERIVEILSASIQALTAVTAAGATIPQHEAVKMMARSVAVGIADRVIDADSR